MYLFKVVLLFLAAPILFMIHLAYMIVSYLIRVATERMIRKKGKIATASIFEFQPYRVGVSKFDRGYTSYRLKIYFFDEKKIKVI